ncbi:MAG TPA: cyclase family protein [Kaistia sp.]|nr:cyclase family protein [Kaistia sp.]
MLTADPAVIGLAHALARCEVIDLAPVLVPNMVRWPTHPDLEIIENARNFEEHGYFLQTLILPEHVGCHVDAPAHAHSHLAHKTIETFPAACLLGPAKKVDVSRLDLQPGDLLSLSDYLAASEADGVEIERGDIALVQFGWDRNLPGGSEGRPHDWWGRNNPGMAEDLCRFFSEKGVKAVGTDTVSADIGQKDNVTASDFGHRLYFLPRDILIIEGLLNMASAPAEFYFVALPLKISGGSGSPIRPVGLVARA